MSGETTRQDNPSAHGGKRAKAGRPSMGRTSQPPKIRPEVMARYRDASQRLGVTVAEAIERAVAFYDASD